MGLLVIALLLLVFVPAVLYLIGRFTVRIRGQSSRENDIRTSAFNRPEASSRKFVQQSQELQEAKAEILRLRQQLQQVEEERDTLMKTSR